MILDECIYYLNYSENESKPHANAITYLELEEIEADILVLPTDVD